MKEIKCVVTEKHPFNNRDESLLIKTFRVFGFRTSSSIKCFSIASTSTGIELLVETLLEEITPMQREKLETEYRQMSENK